MSVRVIEIDGSFGEGGGQILRSCLALALLTGKPFHLQNVRARRPKPGLHPQHLTGVRAAAAVGQAHVRGASLGSTDLVFEPGAVSAGHYHFPIGTAGATGLVLHTVYLPLALRGDAPSEVVVGGGTHVKAAPCYHFLDATWRAYLALFRIDVTLEMKRAGFYPRGGGVVRAVIRPCPRPRGWCQPKGEPVTRVTGFSAASDVPEHVAGRQARRAVERLRDFDRKLRVELTEEMWHAGPGSVLALNLGTDPVPTLVFALGERGKRAELVADKAADEAIAYLRVGPPAVDPHSADQIVLPLAFADGPSEFRVSGVTRHLTTNVAVIGRFVDRRVTVEGEEGGPGVVRVEG